MATYVNDLRLKEIATGDESGTWGTSTNTNLELIAEAFSFGTEAITTNADTHTTTIADGSTDPGRSLFLKYTGTLDSACTITIGPNTVSKLWLIENATSGSQNIIIKQGSGATVTVPNGQTKAIYSDGAGSGGAMVDAFAHLNVVDLTVEDDLTITDDLTVSGAFTLTGNADLNGDLDVDGTTNLDVVDIDGALTQDGGAVFNEAGADVDFRVETSGNQNMLFVDAGSNHISIGTGTDYDAVLNVLSTDNNKTLSLVSTDTDANAGPVLALTRQSSSSAADGDVLGRVDFEGLNDANQQVAYGRMQTFIRDASDGTEDGTVQINHIIAGTERVALELDNDEYVFNNAGIDIDFRVESSSSANALKIDAGNNTIEFGSIPFTSSAGTSNVRFGVNAGNSIQSGGNYNVFIGDNAGTALTTGDENVAIGFNALATEDGHGKNVAIGKGALNGQNAGTDAYNVAVGHSAGTSVTTGIQNTILGGLAGDAMTVGQNNVAIGVAALSSDVGGSRTVAIGRGALETQNQGSGDTNAHNTAVGYGAGASVTTGKHVTIVGALAGDALTSTEYTAVFGSEALGNETAGTLSTAIGYAAAFSQNVTSGATGNTNLGAQAGYYNVTGTNNTRVGYNAGLGASGQSNSGNTLVGATTGDAITTGDQNTAIGYLALTTATTGTRNFAGGVGALNDLTDGGDNVGIGHTAGYSNTAGDYNIALGSGSLYSNLAGSRSVAIGFNALYNQNPSGAVNMNNTALGYAAGSAHTTGVDNTVIGAYAGDGIQTGTENTAVGRSALSATCGDNNTAVGKDAGEVITGSNNTAIGMSAGKQITSGSNLQAFGYHAALTGSPGGAATTGSNAIYLGDENITAAYIQVDWTISSDERDKTDFADLDLGLDFVKALEPVTYYWDKRSKYGDKTAEDYDLNEQTPDGTHKEDWMDIGFKAQSVQALEEAAGYKAEDKKNLTVAMSDDGKQMGLQYNKFVPILVKAIQDQDAIIQSLTARIAALEGE